MVAQSDVTPRVCITMYLVDLSNVRTLYYDIPAVWLKKKRSHCGTAARFCEDVQSMQPLHQIEICDTVCDTNRK